MNRSRQRHAQKPTVLILATSHLANRGQAVFNGQWNDMLTEKRQREIHRFIEDSEQYHLEEAGSYFQLLACLEVCSQRGRRSDILARGEKPISNPTKGKLKC